MNQEQQPGARHAAAVAGTAQDGGRRSRTRSGKLSDSCRAFPSTREDLKSSGSSNRQFSRRV
jgi:hypothetical protein